MAVAAAGACTAISGVNNLEKVDCLNCADAGDSETETASPPDCTGKPDGTNCGAASICLHETCVTSSCGDGFIDKPGGEQCEDDNDIGGDGCTACKFDCNVDGDCDDKNVCTSETCDTSSPTKHLCVAAIASGTPACKTPEDVAGTCKGGACLPPGCGNGLPDGTEECDDGNADDTDGCRSDCKYTCEDDQECNDGDACNGVETCDTATHKCRAGTAVVCAVDGKPGCVGTCDKTTGTCSYPDGDTDGVGCDRDCSDADPARFPGAYECKDGKDNDCNDTTSDGTAPSCLCYKDNDKDGYSLVGAETVTAAATACPAGYTRREPKSADKTSFDCKDSSASAFPGQSTWFAARYCTGFSYQDLSGTWLCGGSWTFDYDCDGVETKRYPALAGSSCTGTFPCAGSGWTTAVPACGQSGSYKSCTFTLGVGCTGTTATRTQECK